MNYLPDAKCYGAKIFAEVHTLINSQLMNRIFFCLLITFLALTPMVMGGLQHCFDGNVFSQSNNLSNGDSGFLTKKFKMPSVDLSRPWNPTLDGSETTADMKLYRVLLRASTGLNWSRATSLLIDAIRWYFEGEIESDGVSPLLFITHLFLAVSVPFNDIS